MHVVQEVEHYFFSTKWKLFSLSEYNMKGGGIDKVIIHTCTYVFVWRRVRSIISGAHCARLGFITIRELILGRAFDVFAKLLTKKVVEVTVMCVFFCQGERELYS